MTNQHKQQEERSLSVEMKIKLIKQQRDFLQEEISNLLTKIDGSLTVVYKGSIFIENYEWLEDQGFSVETIQAETIEWALKCPIINIITVDDDAMMLSNQELEEAEQFDFWEEIERLYEEQEQDNDEQQSKMMFVD